MAGPNCFRFAAGFELSASIDLSCAKGADPERRIYMRSLPNKLFAEFKTLPSCHFF